MISMPRLRIPAYAKACARRGLKLRAEAPKSKKFGLTKSEARRLGIASGVERAKQIIKSKSLSHADAKKVAMFYQRFRNCKTPKCKGAILLWGGAKFGSYAVKWVKKNES